MGLAAGQARLLTITGRKSDCEFESMRLSHQKIAVARELADLSNEYQNSLTKTKLIYDYYGTGDTNTPLTYSTLMTASKLNDYKPTLVTDALGRVALTSEYAAAAAAAGIPQEGLGCLPSEIVRNQFVQALAAPTVGLITQDMADKITAIPYNQGAGYGNGSVAVTLTEDVTYSKLCEMISDSGATVNFAIHKDMISGNKASLELNYKDSSGTTTLYANDYTTNGHSESFDLGDILSGDLDIYYWTKNRKSKDPDDTMASNVQTAIEIVLDATAGILTEYLDIGDGASALALEYALKETKERFLPKDSDGTYINTFRNTSYDGFIGDLGNTKTSTADLYNGWLSDAYKRNKHGGHNWNQSRINVTNILQCYVTYFLDAMNGLNATDLYGNELYSVNKQVDQSNLVSSSDMFTIYTGTEVTSDDLAVATFYDTLLNKICMDGWTENDQVEDPEYLQQMLQNGMLYISKAKDDGYYYQGNYSIDTYIKEIEDTQYIAEAEAKYNTEKAKLNAKEETLDMKMKNLDTEMSALTTEYDTVKNTISKNIEKSFKRYNA